MTNALTASDRASANDELVGQIIDKYGVEKIVARC